MTIALVIFCIGVIGILLFMVWKAPVLAGVSDSKNSKNISVIAKSKIETIGKEIKTRSLELLHDILKGIRKILIEIEKITSKLLKKIKNKKEES